MNVLLIKIGFSFEMGGENMSFKNWVD